MNTKSTMPCSMPNGPLPPDASPPGCDHALCLNACYIRNEHTVTRVIEGETIIVPIRPTVEAMKAIFTLNEMAGVIWERIDGQTSFAELMRSVYREYRVSAEQVTQEVVGLLTTFKANGLIHLTWPHELMVGEGK